MYSNQSQKTTIWIRELFKIMQEVIRKPDVSRTLRSSPNTEIMVIMKERRMTDQEPRSFIKWYYPPGSDHSVVDPPGSLPYLQEPRYDSSPKEIGMTYHRHDTSISMHLYAGLAHQEDEEQLAAIEKELLQLWQAWQRRL